VAVVAAIIRDEIKPAKIWLPAKKISRSHQTKTKRRRGEKKCLQRVEHSQNKICFSFGRFFFDSTSFQTRPLGHRLGQKDQKGSRLNLPPSAKGTSRKRTNTIGNIDHTALVPIISSFIPSPFFPTAENHARQRTTD
jgi:hypothetical protein